MLSRRKKPVNEDVQIFTITPKSWTNYFKNLYQATEETGIPETYQEEIQGEEEEPVRRYIT